MPVVLWRKAFVLILVIFGLIPGTAVGALVAQWNFNSVEPDGAVNTGTNVPSFGVGTATLFGGTTATYATGSGSDPAPTDNSGWNTASYPALAAGNKTRGVQFNVSTLGYERIVVTWSHRHSGTSSRHVRFQYSADGTNFIDGPVFTASAQDTFFARVADLGCFPVINNNSNFGFRIVAEFESTATGSGAEQYVATTAGQTYSANGTWRFDMVTVSGEIFSASQAPTISTLTNLTLQLNQISDSIPFMVGDVESAPEQLMVMASSSNPTLIPTENVVLGGAGANRTVQIFPAADQAGSTTVTLSVTDEAGKLACASFVVTVLAGNTPPTISGFTNYHTVINTPVASIAFMVGDAETAAGNLTITRSSSNPNLIPDTNIVLGGSASNRTLTITPAANQSGVAAITVTLSDGTLATNRSFGVMVVPSASVLLADPFDYPDGSINTNSGLLWSNHSGIAGQTQIASGKLRFSSAQTEDINAALIGAPHYPSNNTVLYAAFTVNFEALPSGLGDYFGHFRESGGQFRARVFATTTNVTLGSFRLGIANTAGSITGAAIFETDLNLQTEYLVVVRYDVATGISSLWVNPQSESDPPAVASDTADADPITSWAFRQSSTQNGSMGTLLVDNLRIGTTFADVLPGYRLEATRAGDTVQVSWPAAATDEGYVLQSAPELSGTWQTVVDIPTRVAGRDRVTVSAPAGRRFYRLVK